VFLMLLAPIAKFCNSQTIRREFFIFSGMIVDMMTNSTFQAD